MGEYLLNAFVTMLVAIDPIALVPLFIALTSGRSPEGRKRIAILASLIAGGVLIGAALVGAWLLKTLGVSLSSFRIAGGLLLFLIAAEMLFDLRSRRRAATVDTEHETEHETVAAFPLAVPLMAGPAAISASILLASNAPNFGGTVALVVIIAVVISLSLGAFILAKYIDRLLGRVGRIVVTRLLGLILAALSVQFVVDGVTQLIAAANAG